MNIWIPETHQFFHVNAINSSTRWSDRGAHARIGGNKCVQHPTLVQQKYSWRGRNIEIEGKTNDKALCKPNRTQEVLEWVFTHGDPSGGLFTVASSGVCQKTQKPFQCLSAATTSRDSAPLWWRKGRLLRLAAGAWTRRAIWGKRRSRWRGGSAGRSPARCRPPLARTSAGPDSSSRDRQKRGFWRERTAPWGRGGFGQILDEFSELQRRLWFNYRPTVMWITEKLGEGGEKVMILKAAQWEKKEG